MPASDYEPLFQAAGKEWNVDPALLRAMAAQESAGRPGAASHVGAQGLMQIMPDTQRALGVTDPHDPAQSIYGAAKYMNEALKAEGTPEKALLYYHGGPGWRDRFGPESAGYVPGIIAKYQQGQPAMAKPDAKRTAADDLWDAALKDAPAAAVSAQPAAAPSSSADDLWSDAMAGPEAAPAPVAAGADGAPLPANNGIGASVLRGLHEATDIPATALASGADYVAGKLGYNTHFAQDAKGAAAPFNQSYDADPANQGWEPAAARLAGNALVTIPASIGAGRIASGVVGGVLSPLAARFASPLVAGAAQGAAADAMTGGDIGAGAGIGAALGGAGGIVGAGVNKLLTSGNPMVEAAVNKFGIPLRAGQVSDSKFVRYLDSQLGNLPGSGQEASNAAQRAATERAISQRFGEDTTHITPAVMQQAKDRIGGVMNDIAERTTIQADHPLLDALGSIETNASKMPSIFNDVRPHITDILETAAKNDGSIPGKAYQALTGKGSALSVAQESGEGAVRNYANQIRDALDDAFERSAAPGDVAKLGDARMQYKNMMTVAPLVNKGVPGYINPLLLQGAANRSFKNNAFRGAGDLGEIADIAQAYLKAPPDSGTATRNFINNTMYGDIKGGARLAAGATAGRLVGSVLRSNPLAGPSGVNGAIPTMTILSNKLLPQQN